jgi:hypothetical protein
MHDSRVIDDSGIYKLIHDDVVENLILILPINILEDRKLEIKESGEDLVLFQLLIKKLLV